jgi:hypothetical protein
MKSALRFLLLAGMAIVPVFGQSTPVDPKASDQNGNGPPAFVLSQGKGDSQSKDDKKKAAV